MHMIWNAHFNHYLQHPKGSTHYFRIFEVGGKHRTHCGAIHILGKLPVEGYSSWDRKGHRRKEQRQARQEKERRLMEAQRPRDQGGGPCFGTVADLGAGLGLQEV